MEGEGRRGGGGGGGSETRKEKGKEKKKEFTAAFHRKGDLHKLQMQRLKKRKMRAEQRQ